MLPANYALLSSQEKENSERTLKKRLYDIFSTISVQLALNFTVMPFLLLEIRPTLQAWNYVHFYGVFLCFVPLAFIQLGGGTILKHAQIARAEEAGAAHEAVTKQREEAKTFAHNLVTFVPEVPIPAKKN